MVARREHGKITAFKSYQGDKPPTIPKPDQPVDPMIVTVQDGVPVVYPGCHGWACEWSIRSIPKPRQRTWDWSCSMSRPTLSSNPARTKRKRRIAFWKARGRMTFANFQRDVKKGDFVYLPPWCEHGIENTGTETLVVLIATSPPNP